MKVALLFFLQVFLFQFYAHSQALKWNNQQAPMRLILVEDSVDKEVVISSEFHCTNWGETVRFGQQGYSPQYSEYAYPEKIYADGSGDFKVGIQCAVQAGVLDYYGEMVLLKSDEPHVYGFDVRTLVAMPGTERHYEDGQFKSITGNNKNGQAVRVELDAKGQPVAFGPISSWGEPVGMWSFFKDGVILAPKKYSEVVELSCFLVDMDSVECNTPEDPYMGRVRCWYNRTPVAQIDSVWSYTSGEKKRGHSAPTVRAGVHSIFLTYAEDSIVVFAKGRKALLYPNENSYFYRNMELLFSKKKENRFIQGFVDTHYRLITGTYIIGLDFTQPGFATAEESKKTLDALAKKYADLGWYSENGLFHVYLSPDKDAQQAALAKLKADPLIGFVGQAIHSSLGYETAYLITHVYLIVRGTSDFTKMNEVAAKYGFVKNQLSGSLPCEYCFEYTKSKVADEKFIRDYKKMTQDPFFKGARIEFVSPTVVLDATED